MAVEPMLPRDAPWSPRGRPLREGARDDAETPHAPLPVLRREGPVHPERGAPRREELPALRDEGRPSGLGTDRGRQAGHEARLGLEGVVAGDARRPSLADAGPAPRTFPAGRRLLRLHDDELAPAEVLPVRGLHEHEREVVGPRLELDEPDSAIADHRVDLIEDLAGSLELEDRLRVAEGERRLPEPLRVVDGDLFRRIHLDAETRQALVRAVEEVREVELRIDGESKPGRHN